MSDKAVGRARFGNAFGSQARLIPFFSLLGISFGFVGVVFAVGYESYFRLPLGVEDQDYVTLLRREADSGRPGAIRLSDVADIVGLVPEVTWAYAGISPVRVTHRGDDGSSEVVSSRYVSKNYLELLGVAPTVGRVGTAPDGPMAAVVSDSLRQRLYGSDVDVVGRLLATDMWGSLPIVGVVAPGFAGVFFEETDVWILGGSAPEFPSGDAGTDASGSQSRTVTTFAVPVVLVGVADGRTPPSALRSLLDSYTFANTDREYDRLELVDGLEMMPDARRDMRERLAWLGLVVALLLMQVFLSLVDRLLAVHHSRRGEQAVRLAVGATPADMFAEMVAAHGGWLLVVGLTAALAGGYIADVLVSVEPFSLYIGEFSGASLAWGFGASGLLLLLALLLSGAYVSRLASRTGRGISEVSLQSGRAVRLARTALLFVAAASLLIVASLAVRYAKDSRASTGVANTEALMLGVIYYGDLSTAVGLMASNPDLAAFAQAEMLPLLAESVRPANRAVVPGRRELAGATFYRNGVAPPYFDVLGIELLAGRVFDDVAGSEVVLARTAAESLAERIEDTLGMAFAYVTDTPLGRARGTQVTTVVGVVEDVAYGTVHEAPLRVFYRMVEDPGEGLFVVRESGRDSDIVGRMQGDRDIEDAYRIGTVAEVYEDLVLARRSAEVVLAVAAVLALTLALAGVGFSLAKEMAGSAHAVGVRLALGATPRDISMSFCARPLLELLLVVALVAALVVVGKLAIPAFLSIVELWLVSLVVLVLSAVVVLVVHWLATRMATASSIDLLLGAG